jgi:hypothetical protein
VIDSLEILGLIIAFVALLFAVFPIRAYLVERYWPYTVRMRDAPWRDRTRTQYRLYVFIKSRTAWTAHFGLGMNNVEQGPPPNYPSWSISRNVPAETINQGDLPVGPHEKEAWTILLTFPRPLSRPVTFVLFNRLPEGGVFPLGLVKPQKFEYELQPITS